MATTRALRTTNDGETYERISPDLTRYDPRTLEASGGQITRDQTSVEYYGTIFAVSESPGRTSSGPRRTTGWCTSPAMTGRPGAKVTPPDVPEWTRMSSSTHRRTRRVLRTWREIASSWPTAAIPLEDRGLGQTWTKIVSGIRPRISPCHPRGSRERRGLLYAARSAGCGSHSMTARRGSHCSSICRPRRSTASSRRNAISCIGTHGRGFYVLDNIGVLRQATAELLTNNALFCSAVQSDARPRSAQRYVRLFPEGTRSAGSEDRDSSIAGGTVLRTFTGVPKEDSPRPPPTIIRSLAAHRRGCRPRAASTVSRGTCATRARRCSPG